MRIQLMWIPQAINEERIYFQLKYEFIKFIFYWDPVLVAYLTGTVGDPIFCFKC